LRTPKKCVPGGLCFTVCMRYKFGVVTAMQQVK
jgi:hypothetical protein